MFRALVDSSLAVFALKTEDREVTPFARQARRASISACARIERTLEGHVCVCMRRATKG